ncbi:MAG TPA: hypothetical protein DCE41_00760 [Cytophagales bacterium]|nr:hypothetical protein [Cytophagales bacterium]
MQDVIGAVETAIPTPASRFFYAARGASTTHGPTDMHKASLVIGTEQLAGIRSQLDEIMDMMPQLEAGLKEAGAPPIETN